MKNFDSKYSDLEETNEILSKMPNSLIRWGMSGTFLVLIVITIFSLLIKYPEVIEGNAIVTSIDPPVEISSSQSKSIRKIYHKNHSLIKKGDVLLEFNSSTSLAEIYFLDSTITHIETQLSNNEFSDLQILSNQNFFQIGQLNKEILELKNYLELGKTKNRINSIRNKLILKKEYSELLKRLHASVEEKAMNENLNYNIQEKLFKEKVISKAQFISDKINYLSKKEQVDEVKKTMIQNQLSIEDNIIDVEILKYERREKLTNFKLSIAKLIYELRSDINNWFLDYTIISPVDGEINFLKNFYTEEYILAGDALFSISSSTKSPIAYCYLTQYGYGEVKVGQSARIMLDNYPFQQFGYLYGKVKATSQFPKDDQYLTIIEFENELLETSNNLRIELVSEIRGSVEIITKDISLMERLLPRQLRKVKTSHSDPKM